MDRMDTNDDVGEREGKGRDGYVTVRIGSIKQARSVLSGRNDSQPPPSLHAPTTTLHSRQSSRQIEFSQTTSDDDAALDVTG